MGLFTSCILTVNYVSDCGACQSCSNVVVTHDNSFPAATSGRMTQLSTSGKSTELSIFVILIIVVAAGTLIVIGV